MKGNIKPMKIAWLTHRDIKHPQAGGAEVVVDEISTRLLAKGHQVTWLCSGFNGGAKSENLNGIHIRRYGPEAFLNWELLPQARHLSRPFDVIIESLCKVPFYWPNYCRYRNIIYTHHLFGSTAHYELDFLSAAYVRASELPISRFYREQVHVAVSPSTRDDLVKRGIPHDKIIVIESGADHQKFGQTVASRENDPLFLHVGRLKKYKQLEIVLEAMNRLRKQHPEAKLVILGQGTHLPALQNITRRLDLESHVQFAGWVDEATKQAYLQRAWALVYPSPKEGQGLSVMEASSSGTPVIASRSPGLKDFVIHEKTGFLVTHSDPEDWCQAMSTLASDRSLCNKYGLAAREFVTQFTWDRAVNRLLEHCFIENPRFRSYTSCCP